MSTRAQTMYVTSVSSSTVTLSPSNHDAPSKAGVGVQQVTVRTTESTAEAGFWGATGTCAVMRVIFQKMD